MPRSAKLNFATTLGRRDLSCARLGLDSKGLQLGLRGVAV